MIRYAKTVAEFADYGRDLTGHLATGETIASVAWTVPAGLTGSAPGNDSTAFWIWLAGGTLDATYTVTALVTTSTGRKIERAFDVRVVARIYE